MRPFEEQRGSEAEVGDPVSMGPGNLAGSGAQGSTD
jgi:hypothetical protein